MSQRCGMSETEKNNIKIITIFIRQPEWRSLLTFCMASSHQYSSATENGNFCFRNRNILCLFIASTSTWLVLISYDNDLLSNKMLLFTAECLPSFSLSLADVNLCIAGKLILFFGKVENFLPHQIDYFGFKCFKH